MIVALGYKKRSGKDTIGDILVTKYGFVSMSFAAPLKELCAILVASENGGTCEDTYARELLAWATEYDMSPNSDVYRKLRTFDFYDDYKGGSSTLFDVDEDGKHRNLLQYMGTDFIRVQYKDSFWLDCLMNKMKPFQSNKELNVVITDVRFPNELLGMREVGVTVNVLRKTDHLEDTHISETALDGYEWDYTVDNNGTLEELATKVGESMCAWSSHMVSVDVFAMCDCQGAFVPEKDHKCSDNHSCEQTSPEYAVFIRRNKDKVQLCSTNCMLKANLIATAVEAVGNPVTPLKEVLIELDEAEA